MARKKSKFKQDLVQWRRVIAGALARAEKPARLDSDYTRGKSSVSYDPEPIYCPKHTRTGKDGGKEITQVTYRGRPLYFYSQDTHPAETRYVNINQFGGLWPAVSAAGQNVK